MLLQQDAGSAECVNVRNVKVVLKDVHLKMWFLPFNPFKVKTRAAASNLRLYNIFILKEYAKVFSTHYEAVHEDWRCWEICLKEAKCIYQLSPKLSNNSQLIGLICTKTSKLTAQHDQLTSEREGRGVSWLNTDLLVFELLG